MSRKRLFPVVYIVVVLSLFITQLWAASPALAAGATTSIRIVKYAEDGVTILADKSVTYDYMEKMLPVYGDGKTHYYHQGPIFEGDLWDPTETLNLKDKGAVKGTAVKDLCDLVGGMSPGDEVSLVAVDKYHEEFGYDNIYRPNEKQGTIALCWYNGEDALFGEKYGEGYPGNNAYRTALQVVFMASNKNSEGKYVFGNTDMKEAMPLEKYQHFYEGAYPSTNGLSGKWIAELRIYTGGIKPDQKIDFTIKDYYGASSGTPAGTAGTPWLPIGLGVVGVLAVASSFVFFRNLKIMALKRGATFIVGIVLVVSSLGLGLSSWQSAAAADAAWNVTLVGKDGTQKVMSVKELKRLPAYVGRGGFFTTTGIVNGPYEARGVTLNDLADLAGGMGPDDIVMVSAEDGYSSVFDYDQLSGEINTYSYNGESIAEVPHSGELKIILAYQQDGKPLTDDDGKPLRIEVVGADNLLTEGNMWVKWVTRIEVIRIKGLD